MKWPVGQFAVRGAVIGAIAGVYLAWKWLAGGTGDGLAHGLGQVAGYALLGAAAGAIVAFVRNRSSRP